MLRLIKRLLIHNESDSLKTKVKKGITWTIAISVWARSLGLIGGIVITRILNSDDFGMIAIANAIIAIIAGLTATGFGSAIIQKQHEPEKLLNSAWTMELLKGTLLFLIIFLLAPFISTYYDEEGLGPMLRVLSITFILSGAQNIGVVWFRKNLDIRKEFVYGAIPDLFYLVFVVSFALWLRSAWSLVYALVLSALIRAIISYIIHPFRPKLDFNWAHYQQLFSFGRWIMLEGIVAVARNQGLSLFIGKYFTMSVLGNFNRGEAFSKTIFLELTRTMWKIGYPTFSIISSDRLKFKEIFLLALKIITTIGFPLAGGLFILSNEFVKYILSDRWVAIVPLIKIFSLNAIIGFIQTPVGISFQSLGFPEIGSKLNLYNLVLFAFLIMPVSAAFGFHGLILTSMLCDMIIFPFGWYKISKILNITLKDFTSSIIPQLTFSFVMVFMIYIIRGNIYPINSIIDLIIYIIIGVFIYVCALFLSEVFGTTNYRKLLITYIR